MVSYNQLGNDKIRNYVYNNFNWLGIVNDSGTELFRVDLLNDSIVTVESGPNTNPVQYTITITGQEILDRAHSLPQTLESQNLYETSGATSTVASDSLRDSNGNPVTATLEAANDTLDIVLEQQIPPQ